ncbi:MAG TPA: FtsW/RodA/SpoVE family cell cycle protein, partial [Steroidobacteraceae bacterium]|nr:FtsW/RodA/SpoVE family cell cycle protein [Steroidobacteraceae bacterium]
MGIYEPIETGTRSQRTFSFAARLLGALKLDGPLLIGLGLITLYGLVVLYSASGQNLYMVRNAMLRVVIGAVAMCALARVKPSFLRRVSPWMYGIGVVLLVAVDVTGHSGKGAQRWLDLGFFRFQPSEIMKLAVPMTCAWWLHDRPLPPSWGSLFILAIIILIPTGLTILQPDLGTGGLILIGGMMVVIMAGLRFRVMFGLAALGAAAAWLAWQYVLYDYQKQRVFTLLDPESDKLGAGYHI